LLAEAATCLRGIDDVAWEVFDSSTVQYLSARQQERRWDETQEDESDEKETAAAAAAARVFL
jgi:hypothetical protein